MDTSDSKIITVNNKRIAVLTVNEAEMCQWQMELGRYVGVSMCVTRAERPDLFESLNCDEITIVLDDVVAIRDLFNRGVRHVKQNL